MAMPRFCLGQIVSVRCKEKWSIGSIIEVPDDPSNLYRIYLVEEDKVILDSWRNLRVSNTNEPVPPAALGRDPMEISNRNDHALLAGPSLEGNPDNIQGAEVASWDLSLDSLLDGSLDNFVMPREASQPIPRSDKKKSAVDFNIFPENLNDSLDDFVIPIHQSQSSMKTDRFKELNDDELDDLQKSSKAEATNKTTRWAVKVFRDWLKSKDMSVDFEQLSSEVLSMLLRRFYGEVMNSKGDSYSKQSLVGIRAGLHRHIRSAPYRRSINIFTDGEFHGANEVLRGRIRVMRISGEDSSSSHPPISSEDISKMYSTYTLSTRDPTSLQYKSYFELALHFGRRGREGLRELKSDSIIFKTDSEGREYATLKNIPHEKNHAGMSNRQNEHDQRMYSTGTLDCPVSSLKLYISKLNPKCSAFFQRPKTVKWEESDIWYNNCPVGRNTIGKFMSSISTKAQLSITYTNHSIRTTTIMTLRNKYFEGNDIVNVTGHRNVSSLEHYSKSSDTVRQNMSSVLTSKIGKNRAHLKEIKNAVVTGTVQSPQISKKRTAPWNSNEENVDKIPKPSPKPNVMDITQFIVDIGDFDEENAPQMPDSLPPPSQVTTTVVNTISSTPHEKHTDSMTVTHKSNAMETSIPQSFLQQGTFHNCTFHFNLPQK